MTDHSATETAEAAVRHWWASIAARDLRSLTAQVCADYVSAGGPGGRTVGRDAFLTEARAFLDDGTRIDEWTVDRFETRLHGSVAICSYEWNERGSRGGTPFALHGEATDVLVCDGTRWRHQAHHVSLTSPGAA